MANKRMQEVRLVKLSDLRVGKPHAIEVPGREDEILLVRKSSDDVVAIGNRCPHKRAKLHKGDIEDLGEEFGGLCVRCPKHRRKFGGGLYVGLADGQCRTKQPLGDKDKDKKVHNWRVPTYSTSIVEGSVYVQIPEDTDSSSDSDTFEGCDTASLVHSFPVTLGAVSPRTDSAGDVFVYDFRLKNSASAADLVQAAEANGACGTAWHTALCLEGVTREYTPINDFADVLQTRTIKLLIKLYDDGAMSNLLRKLSLGAPAIVTAPKPTLQVSMWPASAARRLDNNLLTLIVQGRVRLGLICAGTGVTPCVQVLELAVAQLVEISRQGKTSNIVHMLGLLTCNRSNAGVLMARELAVLVGQAPTSSIKVRHTLTDDGERNWKRPRQLPDEEKIFGGRVSMDMLAETMPPHHDRQPCFIAVTGPPGFAEHCTPLLRSIGYRDDWIIALDS